MKRFYISFIFLFLSVLAFSQNNYAFKIAFIDNFGTYDDSGISQQATVSINGGATFYPNNHFTVVSDTVNTSSTASGTLTVYWTDCNSVPNQTTFNLPLNTLLDTFIVVCDTNNSGLICNSNFTVNHQTAVNSVDFLIDMEYYNNYLFDYGDGNSIITHWPPSYTYSDTGSYTACVTVDYPGCLSTTCDTIDLTYPINCNPNFSVSVNNSEVTVQAQEVGPQYEYQWYMDSLLLHQSLRDDSLTYIFNTAGTKNIRLAIEDDFGYCHDSLNQVINISNINCNSDFYINHHSSSNLVFPKYDLTTSFIPIGAEVKWYLGDGNSLTHIQAANQNNLFNSGSGYAYDSAGTYTISCVVDYPLGNCYDSTFQTVTTTGPGLQQLGVMLSNPVTDSTTPSALGRIYMIEHDSLAGTLTAIDSMDLVCDSNHHSWSNAVFAPGDYLIKGAVIPNEFSYDSILPTYFTNNPLQNQALTWANASPVTFGNFTQRKSINLFLIQGTNPGGPGFIGGLISQGANKTEAVGDPVPNLDVLLLDDQMEPVLATKTNGQGEFEFDDLALGAYYVYPEYAGKTTTPVLVELDGSNQDLFNIDFEANDSGIRPADAVGMNKIVANEFLIFPVPAKDQITIQNNSEQSIKSIKIYNMKGALLFESNELLLQNTSEQIDLNNWVSGTYLIRFQGNNFTSVKSFIKE